MGTSDNFVSVFTGRIAFEKLTDFDYRGTTYYTVKNLSLYECQGWCREEPDCQAAAFSFVVNPLTPMQETLCQLQNETNANNPAAVTQRSVNMYYMTKMQIRSENVCLRPWAFERVPNKMIRGLDNALIYTSTKEACLAACLNEVGLKPTSLQHENHSEYFSVPRCKSFTYSYPRTGFVKVLDLGILILPNKCWSSVFS